MLLRRETYLKIIQLRKWVSEGLGFKNKEIANSVQAFYY
jgi:hypothetical protein